VAEMIDRQLRLMRDFCVGHGLPVPVPSLWCR
jgi:hypothetical protein